MPKPISPADVRQPLSDTITVSPELAPDDRSVAEEAARIYPDTNEGRPTPEEIAVEAFKIYQGRGAGDGADLDDWLEAEQRLRARRRR